MEFSNLLKMEIRLSFIGKITSDFPTFHLFERF